MYRTAEVQDKIRSVQDDLQRINTCIEEHESERSTRYRELRRKEQVFKGTCVCKLFKQLASVEELLMILFVSHDVQYNSFQEP